MTLARRWSAALVALLAVLGLVTTLAWRDGYRLYVVHTGSMEPGLRPGDAVLDGPVGGSVRAGEVLTFAVPSGPDAVVTHRVVSVIEGRIHTRGDANSTPDAWSLTPTQVRGRMVTVLPRIGYVLVYLKQPSGLGSLITAILGLALLWEVFFPPTPAADEQAADPGLDGDPDERPGPQDRDPDPGGVTEERRRRQPLLSGRPVG